MTRRNLTQIKKTERKNQGVIKFNNEVIAKGAVHEKQFGGRHNCYFSDFGIRVF